MKRTWLRALVVQKWKWVADFGKAIGGFLAMKVKCSDWCRREPSSWFWQSVELLWKHLKVFFFFFWCKREAWVAGVRMTTQSVVCGVRLAFRCTFPECYQCRQLVVDMCHHKHDYVMVLKKKKEYLLWYLCVLLDLKHFLFRKHKNATVCLYLMTYVQIMYLIYFFTSLKYASWISRFHLPFI